MPFHNRSRSSTNRGASAAISALRSKADPSVGLGQASAPYQANPRKRGLSAVAAGLVDLAIAFLIQIVLMIYYRVGISSAFLMIPVLVLLTTLLALGVGMWLSALNVKYRDIRYAIPFLIQLWMFASPIIYPESMLQGKLKYVLRLNPLTGIIENFRVALFGHNNFDWNSLGLSTAITLFILIYSAYSFRRMERGFADIV